MITGTENISGTTEVKLIDGVASSDKQHTVERLLIANTDTEEIEITLWLDNGSTHFYILHGTKLAEDVSLDVFDGIPFQFSSTHDLFVKLASGETASVIINYY